MNRQNIQSFVSKYPTQSLEAFLSAEANKQLLIHSFVAYNGSAASNGLGLAHSVSSSQWKVYSLGASDTEVTSTIQAGNAISVFTTTNNYGVLFQAKEKFGMVTFNISQAETGSPVYAYTYWNGSSYASLALKNTPSYAATGEQTILFDPPLDWTPGDGSEDADSSFYSIRVLATTAPSQAVQIDEMKVCKVLAYREEVLPKATLALDLSERKLLLQQGESILGFFQFSDSSNKLEATYQINP